MAARCRSHEFRRIAVVALLAATGVALLPAPAGADGGQGSRFVQADDGGAAYSETKLTAFAAAAQDVRQIASDWGPQIREAENADNDRKAEQIANQADREIRNAIQDAEGISVSEYNAIVEAAREDRDLYRAIRRKMENLE